VIRPSLADWIADVDASDYLTAFPGTRLGRPVAPVLQRYPDYFISLVAELFEMLRNEGTSSPEHWAILGNAFAELPIGDGHSPATEAGINKDDALLFGAASFYFGGFPASANLVARDMSREVDRREAEQACLELLLRPPTIRARTLAALLDALRIGDSETISRIKADLESRATAALIDGPLEWVAARLLERLVDQLVIRNVRAVLPNGYSDFWNPLVQSLLARRVWEFFPSQIQAIGAGLLTDDATYSLQMPTGAGKTALTETLLFKHAQEHPRAVAVLIVPFRSLAAELRNTMVGRLNAMGIHAAALYGGSVPIGTEIRDLDALSVLAATPETLSGLIGADEAFFGRISLVVCDEGHLLDSAGRGVALELLLARMRARAPSPPRFVFVSAIVPNVEEINAWLGGSPDTVVVSDYRPAIGEFARLHVVAGHPRAVQLVMHPEAQAPTQFPLERFLTSSDFQFTNAETGRPNTYPWDSIKTLAVAAGRKAMGLGPVAIFAATKSGNQGAIGLAQELVDQVDLGVALPRPMTFADATALTPAIEYLSLEFGRDWVGTKALAEAAVLHHGDIPQEVREVLEGLVRSRAAPLVICTTTLAEGVNLPIRTMVLYTTTRRNRDGRREDLLTRDIRNLVGRAGRPGASTRGLVICANEREWPTVRRVALQEGFEVVRGALHKLLITLRRSLAIQGVELSNPTLEGSEWLHSFIDGIDSTLVDLAAEEIGHDELAAIALRLADETFASQQADDRSKALLRAVFDLRAQRVLEVRESGRLNWVRRTGTRLRLVDAVADDLARRWDSWADVSDALDGEMVQVILSWAWDQPELQAAVDSAYRLDDDQSVETVRAQFMTHVHAWLSGDRFHSIAEAAGVGIDETLRIQSHAIGFALQTVVDQGLALLELALEARGQSIARPVRQFAEHLRYGVPSVAGRVLAARGLRHRAAFVSVASAVTAGGINANDFAGVVDAADTELETNRDHWIHSLGELVFDNTRMDLDRARAALI
jgi:hypothetical protein